MKEKIEQQLVERKKTLDEVNTELEKHYKAIGQLREVGARTVGAIGQCNELLDKKEPESEVVKPEKTDEAE